MNAPVSHPIAVDYAATFRERALPVLRAQLGDQIFDAWLGRLELAGVAGGTARLTQPTRFLATWARDRYADILLAVLSDQFAGIAKIDISVRTSDRFARGAAKSPARVPDLPAQPKPVEPERAAPKSAPAPPEDTEGYLVGSPLDRNLTFKRFLVGQSNRIAHAAAMAIVDAGREDRLRNNPLFVYGGTGLGKSHLLHAVAHAVRAERRRALCYSLEAFMYGFAATERREPALEKALRDVDVFMVDDLQFLHGERVKTLFEQTVGVLVRRGIQMVVAADRPPADLDNLSDRTRSRLSGGLPVEIKAPDLDLRARMLQGLVDGATWPSADLSPSAEVVWSVASQIDASGRDLAGAVNRLVAHVSATREYLTVEGAAAVIADLVHTREPKRVKIEDIQRLVATHYNVSRADILSSRRTANVVRPRQIAMYLSKVLTLRSLPEIGRRFGGRDHTTVLHATKKIEGLCLSYPDSFGKDVSNLKRMLEDA